MAGSSAGSRQTPCSPILAYFRDGRWLAAGRGLRGKHGEVASLLVLDAINGNEAARLPIEGATGQPWSPGNDRLMTGAEEFRIFGIPGGESLSRVSDPLSLLAFFGPGGNRDQLGRQRHNDALGPGTGASAARGGPGSEPDDRGKSGEHPDRGRQSGETRRRTTALRCRRSPGLFPTRSSIQRDSVQSTATSVIDYSPDGR